MEAPGMAWEEIARLAYLAYRHSMAKIGVDMPGWNHLTVAEQEAMESACRQTQKCLQVKLMAPPKC